MKTSRLTSLTAVLLVTSVQMAFAENVNPSAAQDRTRQQTQTREMTPQERQAMGMERNRTMEGAENAKGKTHRETHRQESGGGYDSRGDGSRGSGGYGGRDRGGGGGGGGRGR